MAETSEQSPLLSRDAESQHAVEKRSSTKRQILEYAAAIIFVFATGVAAWAINAIVNQGDDQLERDETLEWRSQVIGWASAALYCEPQCFINYFFTSIA